MASNIGYRGKRPGERKQESSSEDLSSSCRKRGRRSTNGKVINYDMKHHPMDEILRPGVVALKQSRRSGCGDKLKSNLKKPVQEKSLEVPDLPMIAMKKSSGPDGKTTLPLPILWSTIRLERPRRPPKHASFSPLELPLPMEFRSMDPLDQQLYVLQQGAPGDGCTLPLSWPELIEKLRTAKLFTIRQLQVWGGTKSLKARYAAICRTLEEYFVMSGEPKEPRHKGEWSIMRAEHNHVFCQHPGTNYWASHGDSIVNGSILLPEDGFGPSPPSAHGTSSFVVSHTFNMDEAKTSEAKNDVENASRGQHPDIEINLPKNDQRFAHHERTDVGNDAIEDYSDASSLTHTIGGSSEVSSPTHAI